MLNNMLNVPKGTDVIALRKKMSEITREARNTSKPDKCVLCGRKQTSFCNSHSVPQMSLVNIADNGKVFLSTTLATIEIIDIEKGVKNAGTFHFICNECDSKFFQDYENEINLSSKPTDKMLAEIAVKNVLLQLSKRAQEIEIYRILQEKFGCYINQEVLYKTIELDQKDYLSELEFYKKIAEEDEVGGYQILFWELVPYKVPIATQSAVTLSKDMCGNTINDVSDMSEKTRMQFLHLAIFPLENKSVILAFYHKRDKLYRDLRHQFNSCDREKRLQFINHIVFEYTENYFITKRLKEEISSNDKLLQLTQENNSLPNLGLLGPENHFGIGYKTIEASEIPNFLSKEWAL